jgi:hypothetical protein
VGNRLRAVQRILSVQAQLHRLAQWKLAGLERREDALQERHESLLRFVDEDGAYAALFGDALMRRLRSISEEKAQVSTAKHEQAEKTLEELRRVGQMQRMGDELEDEARQERERQELRDILELLGHRRHASPR